MLISLHIRNYAIIESLQAEFPAGLVILTGETGAGKSIIIDALGLILGERASSDVVRTGTDRAVVEAVFGIAGNAHVAAVLRAAEIDVPEELIIRREVSSKGQSRCFVNDSPVTLTVLKAIGDLLVDLHGQHEHQSLLRPETHVGVLDDFGGLDGMVVQYGEAFARLRALTSELEELRRRGRMLEEKRDLLVFQLQDIDAVAPRSGEEEELATGLTILENAEKLFGTTAELYEILYGSERSVHDLLVIARNKLQDLATIDPDFAGAAQESSSAVAIIAELAKFIQGYNARVEFAPERLDDIRERLGRLAMLKKKHGGSLERVLERRAEIAAELALAENFDSVLERLEADVETARTACRTLAERLSVKRHEVARRVDRAILTELSGLGIPKARFSTRIRQTEPPPHATAYVTSGKERLALNTRGFDEVEFYISTNPGEEERPLARVASGGEVSRIMLALKSILATSDRLPVLIFDEIDVGVSGRIAQAVGRSLKALSGFHQVVAITHLPQIAGLADAHFVVYKTGQKGRTSTAMKRLTLEEQVREVAALMSGDRVTDAGLAGARELMGLSSSPS